MRPRLTGAAEPIERPREIETDIVAPGRVARERSNSATAASPYPPGLPYARYC